MVKQVLKAIEQTRQLGSTTAPGHSETPDVTEGRPAWVPNPGEECQHKVCSACYRSGKPKSWLSLNGILNGEVPPTVATGFSFLYLQARPIVDATIVKNLGYRAVPLVCNSSSFYDEQIADLCLNPSLESSLAYHRRSQVQPRRHTVSWT